MPLDKHNCTNNSHFPPSCCNVTRCTTRTPIPPSQREESCPSTWTAWPSGTPLTSGDPVDCWSTTETVGRALLRSVGVTVVQQEEEGKTTYPLPLPLPLLLSETGQFAIRPDKKSEPKVRKFKHVAMIAGGTGLDSVLLLNGQHLAKKCARFLWCCSVFYIVNIIIFFYTGKNHVFSSWYSAYML